MKRIVTGLALALGLVCGAQAQEVKTVPSVDLDRYAGRWYEIARFPTVFQKKCVGDVTAEYARRADGKITVTNRCRVEGGQIDQALGVAQTVAGSGNAKLKVRFTPDWLAWLPIGWGDYWIIALAPDYSHAVVSDSRREYLWVLARTPLMAEQDYQAAVRQAAEQGFAVGKLVRTRHGM